MAKDTTNNQTPQDDTNGPTKMLKPLGFKKALEQNKEEGSLTFIKASENNQLIEIAENCHREGRCLMSDKIDKNHKQELKEMVKERKPNQPVEEVLTIFCHRHGVSIDTCRVYYDQLVKAGEIKEK